MKKTLVAIVCLASIQSCSSVKEYTGLDWFETKKESMAKESRRTPANNRAILAAPKQGNFNMPNSTAFGYNPGMPQAPQGFPAYSSPNQPPLVIGQAQSPSFAPVQMPNGSVLSDPYAGLPPQDRRNPSFNSETLGFEANINMPQAPAPVMQVSSAQLPSEFVIHSAPTDRGIVVNAPAPSMQFPKLAQIPPAPTVSAQPARLDARVQELKRDLQYSNANRGNIQVSTPALNMPSEMVKVKTPSAPYVRASVNAPMLKPIAVEPVMKRSVSSDDSYSTSFAAPRPSYNENRQAMTTLGDLSVPRSSGRSRTNAKVKLPARYATDPSESYNRHSRRGSRYN